MVKMCDIGQLPNIIFAESNLRDLDVPQLNRVDQGGIEYISAEINSLRGDVQPEEVKLLRRFMVASLGLVL